MFIFGAQLSDGSAAADREQLIAYARWYGTCSHSEDKIRIKSEYIRQRTYIRM